MGIGTILKDPEEKWEVEIDWEEILGAESILTSSWASSYAALIVSDDGTSGDVTSVYVSGGTVGVKGRITNTITTDGAVTSTYERSIEVRVEQR